MWTGTDLCYGIPLFSNGESENFVNAKTSQSVTMERRVEHKKKELRNGFEKLPRAEFHTCGMEKMMGENWFLDL